MGPCEVMDCDGEDMSVMMGPSNLNIYEHRFINTCIIQTSKWGPHKGHNRKYMEVEGPWCDLPDHCSQWVELLAYQEDNMLLG